MEKVSKNVGVKNSIALRAIIRVNYILRKTVSRAHKIQLRMQWGDGTRNMWFDRNLAFSTINTNDCTNYTERIGFSTFFLHDDAKILELGFGDGYSAGNYLYRNSSKLVAIDNDKNAFQSAQRNYPSIADCFIFGNYLRDFPVGEFTNVIWDAGIGYFNNEERNIILEKIKSSVSENGILTGFTIQAGVTTHNMYKYLPTSKQELVGWLEKQFNFVLVLEKNLNPRNPAEKGYFFAASNDAHFLRDRMASSLGDKN
jgi:hypothetical protein